eukprot:587457-Prorocentrum_minimum.AAC.2
MCQKTKCRLSWLNGPNGSHFKPCYWIKHKRPPGHVAYWGVSDRKKRKSDDGNLVIKPPSDRSLGGATSRVCRRFSIGIGPKSPPV